MPTPDPGCTNCDGRGCMSCIFREVHDACENDCPFCCPREPDLELDPQDTITYVAIYAGAIFIAGVVVGGIVGWVIGWAVTR